MTEISEISYRIRRELDHINAPDAWLLQRVTPAVNEDGDVYGTNAEMLSHGISLSETFRQIELDQELP